MMRVKGLPVIEGLRGARAQRVASDVELCHARSVHSDAVAHGDEAVELQGQTAKTAFYRANCKSAPRDVYDALLNAQYGGLREQSTEDLHVMCPYVHVRMPWVHAVRQELLVIDAATTGQLKVAAELMLGPAYMTREQLKEAHATVVDLNSRYPQWDLDMPMWEEAYLQRIRKLLHY